MLFLMSDHNYMAGKDDTKQINQALSLVESGLSYHLPAQSRYSAEDALSFLRQGRVVQGYEALADAAAYSDGMAHNFLVQARTVLAPERIASA